jgi:hypothetical protein
MDSDSADEVNPEAALDDVLSKLGEPIKECTKVPDEQGGGAPDINVEDITVLIILFHGTVELTEKQPTCRGKEYCGPTINVSNLSSIENLAYLALAPTGLSNIGTNHELHAYRTYFEYEIKEKIVESLQKIETRADELVYKHNSTYKVLSKICKYCFSYSIEKLSQTAEWLGKLLTNYRFTNTFTVCKSNRGAGGIRGGTGRIPQLSMSHDMFVLMLNELRLKIKKFDSERVTNLCTEQLSSIDPAKQPELHGYCKTLEQTLGNIKERCRSLHVLKGLGLDESQLKRFINKHLSYDSSPTEDGESTVDEDKTMGVDEDKNMGVIKLKFKINSSSGNVECIPIGYNAHDVMKAIAYSKPHDEVNGGVYWSTMEACIQHCTKDDDPRSKTTFVIDLTCSSLLGAECSLLKESSGYITYPGGGGGKRIKKKSGSRKKTRRVKNKSRTTRYIRNRRNRLKNNKRTKKSRKTKTSRKH